MESYQKSSSFTVRSGTHTSRKIAVLWHTVVNSVWADTQLARKFPCSFSIRVHFYRGRLLALPPLACSRHLLKCRSPSLSPFWKIGAAPTEIPYSGLNRGLLSYLNSISGCYQLVCYAEGWLYQLHRYRYQLSYRDITSKSSITHLGTFLFNFATTLRINASKLPSVITCGKQWTVFPLFSM